MQASDLDNGPGARNGTRPTQPENNPEDKAADDADVIHQGHVVGLVEMIARHDPEAIDAYFVTRPDELVAMYSRIVQRRLAPPSVPTSRSQSCTQDGKASRPSTSQRPLRIDGGADAPEFHPFNHYGLDPADSESCAPNGSTSRSTTPSPSLPPVAAGDASSASSATPNQPTRGRSFVTATVAIGLGGIYAAKVAADLEAAKLRKQDLDSGQASTYHVTPERMRHMLHEQPLLLRETLSNDPKLLRKVVEPLLGDTVLLEVLREHPEVFASAFSLGTEQYLHGKGDPNTAEDAETNGKVVNSAATTVCDAMLMLPWDVMRAALIKARLFNGSQQEGKLHV